MYACPVWITTVVLERMDQHVQFNSQAQHGPILRVKSSKQRFAIANVTNVFDAENIGVLLLNLVSQLLQHVSAIFHYIFHLWIFFLFGCLFDIFAFHAAILTIGDRLLLVLRGLIHLALLHCQHLLLLVLHLFALPSLKFHLPNLPPLLGPICGLQILQASVDLLLLDPLPQVVNRF
eukprot:Skav223164  [mRNA]  locus=scaffold3747:62679:66810:- [translate_table: standard]